MPWDRIVPVEEVGQELIAAFSCGDDRMDAWFPVQLKSNVSE